MADGSFFEIEIKHSEKNLIIYIIKTIYYPFLVLFSFKINCHLPSAIEFSAGKNRMENDTVWLTQAQMAELFQKDRTVITRHINNIYKVEELEREATCAKIAQVQIEGNRKVTRNIPYFNLDMIISVGYRIKSQRGVKFRQ